jgi:hypothetical protein
MLILLQQYLTAQELGVDALLAILLVLSCLAPRCGSFFFDWIENSGTKIAKRKGTAIVVLGLLPIVVRLSLLPITAVPTPRAHDEFSYLLAADTFSHGRLTNPPHSLWRFFDTIHVNQHPSYMSKFPPAQGAALALGQKLGNPWIGVLLSVGLMCGAMLWMFQGWLPPSWALVGGVLVTLRVGILSYWMNSYWGGAIPAIGGALVIGVLPRILRSPEVRHGILLALGTVILMNSRPFEGLALCVPAFGFLVFRFVKKRSPSLKVCALRVILPFCLILAAGFAFMGYYNAKGTGNVFLMPYMLNERTYLSTPTFLWQRLRPPTHFDNPQLEEFYNGWSHDLWMQASGWGIGSLVKRGFSICANFVYFFMWPELCILLLAFVRTVRDRRIRMLIIEVSFCFMALLLIAWFQPHYAAPALGSAFVLLVQCMRHVRHWKFKGRPIGLGLTRAVMVSTLVLVPFHPHTIGLGRTEPAGIQRRAVIEETLESLEGRHLVIVHYGPEHWVLEEWVYNKSDIDHAKVVWAREIPGVSISPLLNYYADRRVWRVDADSTNPIAIPYDPPR